MKICIVAEGSYPYITGGVSSWIQTLIRLMPEHEFIIYSIGAHEESKGKFKYKFPDNIIDIQEVFLDSYLNETGEPRKRYTLKPSEKAAIKGLITGEYFDWQDLFRFIDENRDTTVSELLMSKDFFDIIREVCEEYFPYVVFNDFFWTIRSMVLALFEVIKKGIPKADLYHSVSTGYAGVMAAFGKYKYGAPLVLTEHGIYTREREEELIKADWVKGHFKDIWIKYFYNLSRCAYSFSDSVITLFDRNKKVQIEIGCAEDKISVVPNGINCRDYIDINVIKEDENIINIGAILRVVPIKDIKTIIQGFEIASEKIKNIQLFIMGPVDEDLIYTEECKSFTKSLGLKNVIFTGQVNVRDYIGKMDVLVLGSISEGQPLAVLEGMATKKPHILTDVGSCRELMYGADDDFGDAGIVVPVMDYEAFGAAIIRLSQDKKLREDMGKSAYNRVSKLYTIDNFINSYRKIYDEVVGEG
ncbi:MAG: GT4 family glycosyltransferase PelF [Clostridiaceae bacterium]|nr:GT4 family glycosyltransferase PelF [Clostridiaceae bacterium]